MGGSDISPTLTENMAEKLSTTIDKSSWEKPTPPQPQRHLEGLTIRTTEADVHRTPEEHRGDEQEAEKSYDGSFSGYESDPPTRTLTCAVSDNSSKEPRPSKATSKRMSASSDASTGNSAGGERNSTASMGSTERINEEISAAVSEREPSTTASWRASEVPGASGGNLRAKTPSIAIPGTTTAEPNDRSPRTTAVTSEGISAATSRVSGASVRDNGISAATNRDSRTRNRGNQTTAAPNDIKVVIAGKSGAGKSALINNLLRTEEEIELSPDSTTDRLIIHKMRRDNITIKIIDTPGLKEEGREKRKQLKELSQFTNGSADLLVYCIPVAPGLKFTDANPTIMRSLQDVFGPGVWDNCVVVFTFSNLAWSHIRSSTDQEEAAIAKYKAYIQSYADRFQQALVRLKALNVEVGTVFDLPPHPRAQDDITVIPAVPAGYRVQDSVLADLETDHENWTGTIFLEMIEKCKDEHKTAFLQYRYGKEKVKKALGRYGVVVLGGSGGGALIMAGAVVGSTVGILGGPIGMVLGGTIGAAAGIVASTVLSGGIAANSGSTD